MCTKVAETVNQMPVNSIFLHSLPPQQENPLITVSVAQIRDDDCAGLLSSFSGMNSPSGHLFCSGLKRKVSLSIALKKKKNQHKTLNTLPVSSQATNENISI